MNNLKVENDKAKNCFEIKLEDAAAIIAYRKSAAVYDLYHTEVPKQFAGKGIGSALAKGTLDQIREEGAKITPTCPFVADYVARHQEYQDLVAK